MEMNREYASKGVAGAGLGTGIAGLSLGVLNSLGGLGALAGTWGRPATAQNDVLTAALTAEMLRGRSCAAPCGSDCDPVTQRELRLTQTIAEKDSQIALRDANTYGDQKALEMYKYIDGRCASPAGRGKVYRRRNCPKDSHQCPKWADQEDCRRCRRRICCPECSEKSSREFHTHGNRSGRRRRKH